MDSLGLPFLGLQDLTPWAPEAPEPLGPRRGIAWPAAVQARERGTAWPSGASEAGRNCEGSPRTGFPRIPLFPRISYYC